MWTGWVQNCYGTGWGNGNFSAAFSYFPGTLSQTFSTTAGASYEISFLLMHDSSGGTQDIAPYYPATQNLQVFWNGSLLWTAPTNNFALVPEASRYSSATIASVDWGIYTLTVLATGASSTISFAGQDTGGHYYLDNVSVNPLSSVPIPGPLWLLGSGLVGLAGLRRFRKS
jgi:hypothetical protein